MQLNPIESGIPHVKSDVSTNVVKCLSLVIPLQAELLLEAAESNSATLAELLAYQIFDLLDWARLNLGHEMSTLCDSVLADIPSSLPRFDNLQQFEDYVEAKFDSPDKSA